MMIISLCLLSLLLTTPASADSITLGFDQPVISGTGDVTINLVISGLGVGAAPSLGAYDLYIAT
jgi:hypothetical protein